jgi:cytochrome c1
MGNKKQKIWQEGGKKEGRKSGKLVFPFLLFSNSCFGCHCQTNERREKPKGKKNK